MGLIYRYYDKNNYLNEPSLAEIKETYRVTDQDTFLLVSRVYV